MDLDNLKNNPDQIKMLISVLQELLPKTEPEKKTKKKTTKNKFGNSNIRTANSKTKSTGKNYFDEMPEKDRHKEDTEIDKKLQRYPPTERRSEIQLVSVKCRSCGKSEKVSPSFIFDANRYKCNACSSNAG